MKTNLILLLLFVSFIALGQDSTVTVPEDSTNDAYDWAAKIIAAISVLFNGWQAWVNSKLGKSRDVITEAINGIDNGLTADRLKAIIERGRDVAKK